jgi:hypothetical protein
MKQLSIDTLEELASQVDMLLSDNLIEFARLVIERAREPYTDAPADVKTKLKEFFESQDPAKLMEALRCS